MQRTTIVAEERVLYRLREVARARRMSFGALVREALDEKLEREQPPLSFLGVDDTPPGRPGARQADEEDAYRPDAFRSG